MFPVLEEEKGILVNEETVRFPSRNYLQVKFCSAGIQALYFYNEDWGCCLQNDHRPDPDWPWCRW